ncbi:sialoadhesin isoform X2 [Salmo salar]|uniref:B-cell receptor CD22 n=1 Tax=Salmo salar TaxID=8030 RepID=A0A1S3QCB9_SALSA|nr:sialoadhesin isoform X2 [Salmo salar]|eukprot:XP_014037640.1 PREDICTED: sialoadhesin-like isoform X2 [Salmo salar]
MALRTAGSVLVVFLLSVAANTATKCGQQSQVMVPPTNAAEGQKTLTCSTTCTLTDNPNPTYNWYKNGQRLDEHISQQYSIHIYYSDIYSCAVKGYEDLLSPAVCVLGQNCFNVTYTHQSICAMKGSTVELPCTYQYPSYHVVSEPNWYIQEKYNEAPKMLSSVPEYAGRAEYLGTEEKDCTLRITDLRERDSAEYKFRFKTQYAEWGYSFSGTTLTVTVEKKRTLTCSTTCLLTDNPNPTYIWYKNGQHLHDPTSQQYSCNTLVVWCYSADSYSCAVKDHEDVLTPTVCVQGQSCLNVTYTKRSICALKGSTVDITCTYRHPSWHNVTEVSWFNKWESGVTTDLSQDPEYAGRVKYLPTTEKDSTLRITDLRESDSAEYKFRFTTTAVKWGYSFPGITLNVTDLQVKESPGTEEGKVTLTCSTTCTLTDNPTYIWYKNGQLLTNPNTQDNFLYLDQISSEDAGSYSCSVKGYRSPVTFVGEPKSLKNAVVGIIVVILILILCLFGFMWFRKKTSKSTTDTRDRRDTAENGQRDSNPVYDNISGMAMTPTAAQRAITDEQDDVTYASIQHRNQEVPPDSTFPLSHPQKQDEDFQYATVKFNSPSAAQ